MSFLLDYPSLDEQQQSGAIDCAACSEWYCHILEIVQSIKGCTELSSGTKTELQCQLNTLVLLVRQTEEESYQLGLTASEQLPI